MTLNPDVDEGGRQLAGHVLTAAAHGDEESVASLLAPLDADQLRALVTALAKQVDQSMPAIPAGPAAVCDMAIEAAAQTFGVSPESLVSSERSRTVTDARAVAMTAARQQGLSLPAIATSFDKDHTSVIHALRRTGENPRLADAAARISQHVQGHFSTILRVGQTVPQAIAPTPQSAFEPSGVVQHAIAAAAEQFGTTPEVLMGDDKSRATGDARAVAMTAARMQGQTLSQIAREFDRDHTTVLAATRRIEKTPPLRDVAANIAQDLPTEPTPEQLEPALPQSDFEPTGVVQHAMAAAAAEFGTTPEVLMSADRTGNTRDARAVAMTAARIHGESLPRIAREFDRDHTTVLAATRRIEKTPQLLEVAAKIAQDLPAETAAEAPAPVAEVTPMPSRGVRGQQRAVNQQPSRTQLRVAR